MVEGHPVYKETCLLGVGDCVAGVLAVGVLAVGSWKHVFGLYLVLIGMQFQVERSGRLGMSGLGLSSAALRRCCMLPLQVPLRLLLV